MTRARIKDEITKKLNEGVTKSKVYDLFKDEVEEQALRKILAAKPSFEHRQKFKRMHIALSIIWGLFLLLELVSIVDLTIAFDIGFIISLSISIYITIHIWNFDGRFFLPGIVWFVFTLANSLKMLDSNDIADEYYGFFLIITGVYSLMILLGIYLMYQIRKHVFGYFKWFQPIVNQDEKIQFE